MISRRTHSRHSLIRYCKTTKDPLVRTNRHHPRPPARARSLYAPVLTETHRYHQYGVPYHAQTIPTSRKAAQARAAASSNDRPAPLPLHAHAPPSSVPPVIVISLLCPSAPLQALSRARTSPRVCLSSLSSCIPSPSYRFLPLLFHLFSFFLFCRSSFALIVYSPSVNRLWSSYTIARFIPVRPSRCSNSVSPQPRSHSPCPRPASSQRT